MRHTFVSILTAQGMPAERVCERQDTVMSGGWVNSAHGKNKPSVWLTEWEQTTHNLRPSTRARGAVYIQTHILPHFGNLTLGSITQLGVDPLSWHPPKFLVVE